MIPVNSHFVTIEDKCALCFSQEGEPTINGRNSQSDTEDSDDDLPDMDLASGNKDTCVMEVSFLNCFFTLS